MSGHGAQRNVGLCDFNFTQQPAHEEALRCWVRSWLKEHRVVFAGCEDEAATQIVSLAKQGVDRRFNGHLPNGTATIIPLQSVGVHDKPNGQVAATRVCDDNTPVQA